MTAGSFPPCLRQTSSTYTRYAVVGLPSAGQKSHRRGGIFSALPASDLLGVHPVRRRQLAIGKTKNLAAVAGYISALPSSDPVRRR